MTWSVGLRWFGVRDAAPVGPVLTFDNASADVQETLRETDEQALRDLVGLAVEGIRGCDSATISLLVDGEVATVAATSNDATEVDLAQYRVGDGPCLTAIRQGQSVVVDDFALDGRWVGVAAEACGFGIRSSLSLPLLAGASVVGGLNLYGRGVAAFDQESRRVAAAISRQSAIALLYLGQLRQERAARAVEHRIAETLQRGLLPQLPDLPGITCAARYVVSAQDTQVGGDWYDVFGLPGGAIGIAVGDVMGHDVVAAAAMGQLRSVLRCYAYEGSTPSVVLDRMDRLVQSFQMAQLATAIYARLVLDSAGGLLMFSNAGHLPPLLRLPDATVRRLEGAPSRLIGAPIEAMNQRSEAAASLPFGSQLVLFTDGLVESRCVDVDQGIANLADILRTHPDAHDPELLAEAITSRMVGPSPEDDVALLVIRIDGPIRCPAGRRLGDRRAAGDGRLAVTA
ncbi:MAG: hypothetical protein QOF39_1224 [Frankiales bacterium]|nr:hypothetical protein [Frankiales bacterium]